MNDGYIQPRGFILMRVISGVLLFSLFHFLFVRERIERKDIGKLILCGLTGVAINQMFFFMGLNLTTPINASLIMTTTPMLVIVASAILLRERITIQKVIGIALGATGAITLILYGQELSFSKDRILGDLMIFINATSYGIYLVLVRSLMKKYHPITIVKWGFTFGALFVFPFSITELMAVEWHTFNQTVWLAVAYVLICTTFFAYLLNAFALKTVQATTASTYIYLQPLLATLIAVAYQSDQLVPLKMVSALLIFAGVYLVSMKPAKKV